MTIAIELEIVLRLLLAAVLGAAVGIQREMAIKPAGVRDNTLICRGAALFTAISSHAFPNADPSRIAAGVVTGIGFLGAGSIIRRGSHVEGLTTAATIWAVAAIGLATGAGLYLIAVMATAIIVGVLFLPHRAG